MNESVFKARSAMYAFQSYLWHKQFAIHITKGVFYVGAHNKTMSYKEE